MSKENIVIADRDISFFDSTRRNKVCGTVIDVEEDGDFFPYSSS